REGPGMAVGDIDNNGLEDLVIGNGRKAGTAIFKQTETGSFIKSVLNDTTDTEDAGSILFDYDNDQDLDLYIASGSSEFPKYSGHFKDRLFNNDGSGVFTVDTYALPPDSVSGSVVTAGDFDRDGDLDLFVGGRLIPQTYPFPEKSSLLRNDKGKFTDVTASLCRELTQAGLVTSALWTDYNQDGWIDLMIAGEWMPIRVFKNSQGKFAEVTEDVGLAGTGGWWRSIVSADFDLDGDLDYIAGNQGLNIWYKPLPGTPVYINAGDFDNNGNKDFVISAFLDGDYYPVHLRFELFSQLPYLQRKYPTFHEYAHATTSDIFPANVLKAGYQSESNIFESIILINYGSGAFDINALPFEAQFAPVFGMLPGDFNGDHLPDVLLVGNDYGMESFIGKSDAFVGLLLAGKGNCEFVPVPAAQSGFDVDGDARSLVGLNDKRGNSMVIAAQNNAPLRIFRINQSRVKTAKLIPQLYDRAVRIFYNDGKVEVRELHYGSGYLSQTSRMTDVDTTIVERIEIIDYSGKTRRHTF
ncbi:MAG TPA: VCBS repeat-containing protein, partial [Cyclobacteriaceae bacterium]|nr:VCBS repeat-containing protein [Cyclobacteriaceae bacterium]